MSTVIADHDVTVLLGDVREQLATLEPVSVQSVVTSPPYYGLRDYGTGTWEGGDTDCDHGAARIARRQANRQSGIEGGAPGSRRDPLVTICRCGARRVDQQLGLEPSPAEYVAALVDVFRGVRRVLADDGVLWLNLGDSYAGGGNGYAGKQSYQRPAVRVGARGWSGMPAKNLLGIPWRAAFALQDDGWTLRNAVIWHKPNAMPESVTDRLSTRYEHVFLFSKSRRYWFDLAAIREPLLTARAAGHVFGGANKAAQLVAAGSRDGGTARRSGNTYDVLPDGRNPGDVWTIPTAPFSGAHFACMPPELARRCILAGCPEGGTVLDPFAGSGTTLMVARQLNRKAIGIELNPAYIDIIRRRIGPEPMNFGEVTA